MKIKVNLQSKTIEFNTTNVVEITPVDNKLIDYLFNKFEPKEEPVQEAIHRLGHIKPRMLRDGVPVTAEPTAVEVKEIPGQIYGNTLNRAGSARRNPRNVDNQRQYLVIDLVSGKILQVLGNLDTMTYLEKYPTQTFLRIVKPAGTYILGNTIANFWGMLSPEDRNLEATIIKLVNASRAQGLPTPTAIAIKEINTTDVIGPESVRAAIYSYVANGDVQMQAEKPSAKLNQAQVTGLFREDK